MSDVCKLGRMNVPNILELISANSLSNNSSKDLFINAKVLDLRMNKISSIECLYYLYAPHL